MYEVKEVAINDLRVIKGSESLSPQLEAGDLLVEYLAALGVEFVFGIPGGAIEPLFNALARSERKGGPRIVVARHETGSVFMAEGYARNTGNLGVCCATTGPGATNLLTGVASAYQDHIPLLVITAQTALQNFGRNAFQESSDTGINLIGMFQYCTAYNTLVSHIDQFEHKLVSAIDIALHERRPVHLSVPIDIFRANVVAHPIHELVPRMDDINAVDTYKANQLCELLVNARKSVFVLGSGANDAVGLIQKCAFKLGSSLVTTPDGKGLISPWHPLFKGVIGFAGHLMAREALKDPEVDVIVAVGTSLGEWATGGWESDTLFNSRLIHIDPSTTNLARSPIARLQIQGPVLPVFETLHGHLEKAGVEKDLVVEQPLFKSKNRLPQFMEDPPELKAGWQRKAVLPQWLMLSLPRFLPPDTQFFADVGNSMAWAIHYLHPYDRRIEERRSVNRGETRTRRSSRVGLFQATIEFASMGWAIGVAIGAALASRDQPVVCITGDGSLLMNGQEITVALQENLPIVFIVLNDAALGMVKHGQRLTGAEQTGFSLPQVDFAMLAQAVGVRGVSIRCPQDLLELVADENWWRQGPLLLDVHVDKEQVPPIFSRTNILKNVLLSR